MTTHRIRCTRGLALAVLWAGLLLANPAAATAQSGPEGVVVQGRRFVPAEPVAGAVAASHALINGRIEAVDVARRELKIAGHAVAVAAGARLVSQGQQLGADLRALRPGQQIRFALDAGTAADRPIVLIYIDAAP